MMRVYRATGKKSSIFYIALMSAIIKLANLFLPGSIDKVINPAISILLEGVSFMIVVGLINFDIKKPLSIITFNSLWRVMYCFYLFLAPKWIFEKSALISIESYIEFILISNIKTCITTWGFLFLENKMKFSIRNIKPAFVYLLLFINVACTMVL